MADINEQFYDAYNLESGQFIMRATLPTLATLYKWHRHAEARVQSNGAEPTDLYGNGKHEEVRLAPVMDDWQPSDMPKGAHQ